MIVVCKTGWWAMCKLSVKILLSLYINFQIQEDLLAAKTNYEALNSHLLEELPTLNSVACEVFVECLAAFVVARKMLSGKITREYLALMEVQSFNSNCQAKSFLRNLRCLSFSRNSLHFIEPRSFINI
jgi:hypothetical protein